MSDTALTKLARHMPEVKKYEKELSALSERWDLLTLLGQMSNVDMDMSGTRQEFEQLTELLLVQLAEERLKKVCSEINSKAQVSVDIIIRNLFERTADIGFLATDEDIRKYFKAIRIDEPNKDGREQLEGSLKDRFAEYTLKYSVYSNVILIDKKRKVLLQLDDTHQITESTSSFIEEAMTTSESFVEYYGYTDLNPTKENSLIYAYKVTETNDPSSQVLGVLALEFKFEDEMSSIFNNLLTEEDWVNISLLNKERSVISSSDTTTIRLDSKLQNSLTSRHKVVRFAGQEFLSKTCKTHGYQGFFGLDWLGHVMVPLAHAFDSLDDEKESNLDKNILKQVIRSSNIFGKKLATIPKEAEKIQRKLDVTVWNGNVKIANAKTNDNSFSRSLLQQISKTGLKTKTVFEDSINNLNNTVISSILNDGVFMAKLAVDIMDRNLYERANDCRWWALTTFFRQSLKTATPDADEMGKILAYINNLYTVYTNLFIYNKNGVVLAVSNPSNTNLIGTKIHEDWINKTLNLTNSQQYTVSDFNQSLLYSNKHTYIYNACITDINNSNDVLGGIGIVFDSEPEFKAILEDSLPLKLNEEQPSYFALFCDNEKKVISSSNPDINIGETLAIADAFFNLEQGQSHTNIIEYDNKYYAVASSASKGYREYKTKDNYNNDVFAIVFTEISDISQGNTQEKPARAIPPYTYPKPQVDEETIDVSTFFVEDKVYGIESKYIIASLNDEPLTDVIGSDDYLIGVIVYKKRTISIISLYSLITDKEFNYNQEENDIIILEYEVNGKPQLLGLVVDDICDSSEIGTKDLQDHKSCGIGKGSLVKYIVSPERGINKSELLSILDIPSINNKISK